MRPDGLIDDFSAYYAAKPGEINYRRQVELLRRERKKLLSDIQYAESNGGIDYADFARRGVTSKMLQSRKKHANKLRIMKLRDKKLLMLISLAKKHAQLRGGYIVD